MKLTAIILTRNEGKNIRECLAALTWADEKIVVDSGSIDRTVELAKELGARVIEHPMKDFADQRNFAMTKAQGDWVLFVDADERVTPELEKEIQDVILSVPRTAGRAKNLNTRSFGLRPQDDGEKELSVYAIPRLNYFFGKPLRFGDSRGDTQVRLFPRNGVRWIQPVHEVVETALPRKNLVHPLLHYSTRDLTHYRQKILDYIPQEIKTMRSKGISPSLMKVMLMPPIKFFFLFFWKFGVFDGITGFQYAILSAYYTFKKYWIYWKHSH